MLSRNLAKSHMVLVEQLYGALLPNVPILPRSQQVFLHEGYRFPPDLRSVIEEEGLAGELDAVDLKSAPKFKSKKAESRLQSGKDVDTSAIDLGG